MNGQERREKLLDAVAASAVPLSGSALAQSLGVSRQVIVQDIALLRAAGHNIISTNRGYVLQEGSLCTRVFKVSHTDEQVEDELNSIVDLGGNIVDVFVNHKVYGRMTAKLNIKCRHDVSDMVELIKSGKSSPLKNITSNYHYHTVTADSENILDEIEKMLDEKGYLIKGEFKGYV